MPHSVCTVFVLMSIHSSYCTAFVPLLSLYVLNDFEYSGHWVKGHGRCIEGHGCSVKGHGRWFIWFMLLSTYTTLAPALCLHRVQFPLGYTTKLSWSEELVVR